MSPGRARLLRASLRVAGLALVAYVIAFQVRWTDEVRRVDPKDPTHVQVLHGRVTETPDEVIVDTDEAGAPPIRVPRSEIATSRYGDRADIPAIAYGFPSLARRLASSWPTVALAMAALMSLVLATAWRWRWLVQALGLVLSAADAVRFTLYGIFFNLVVPGATGGDVVKAYYAAKRTGVATKAVVSVFVDRAVGLFALVLLAAAVLWLGPDRPGYRVPRLLVLTVLGATVALIVLVLSRRVRRAIGLSSLLARLPFQGVLREVDAAFVLYRQHPRSLGLGLLVSLANHAGTCFVAWALAQALGLTAVTPWIALALVPVVNLMTAIPLLPGGWGVGELAFAFFFSQVGVAPSDAVGLSVVYRVALLASGLPGGVLWLLSRDTASREEMAGRVAEAERAAGALAE